MFLVSLQWFRQSVAKLKKYAELMEEIALLSSGESSATTSRRKGKGKVREETSAKRKGKAKGKSAMERLMKEMEEIEAWLMSKKNITVETESNMQMLKQISEKCGGYQGKIKLKCRDPAMRSKMKKTATEEGMNLF